MLSSTRQKYNQNFSVEKYKNFLADIDVQFPNLLDFRVAESPIFVPKYLENKIIDCCESIIDTITKPDFKAKTNAAIPLQQNVPNEDEHTQFLAIDFAICKNSTGELEPQLIELQGFPSLFAYQSFLGNQYQKHFQNFAGFSQYFNGLDEKSYLQTMKDFLLANENPENVILLEIYPEKQKTRLDFALTEKYWGIKTLCLTKIIKEGRKLFYNFEGHKIEIKRIYNRLIFDDLAHFSDLKTDFNLTDDVDVVWIGHPNWFFRISKFTLPFLEHQYIPESVFLSDFKKYPTDLENYVLKPLFSFAGTGVQLNIKKADLEQIKDPENYILQRKVKYEPVIQSPNGLVKCEIRMLYIWQKNEKRPLLVTNLARLSRGEMIGVNFNKTFDWVGASVAFYENI